MTDFPAALPAAPVTPTTPTTHMSPTTLLAHATGVALVMSTAVSVTFMLPIIAKTTFDATPTVTWLLTAPPVTLFVLSIFWNSIFQRISTRRYWTIYWGIACLPLALACFTSALWPLVTLNIISCCGIAGYHPAAGELFKKLYANHERGRAYGVVTAASTGFGAAMCYALGLWLKHDPFAYQIFLPITAGVQGAGVLVLASLAGHEAASARKAAITEPFALRRVLEPIVHMRRVLAGDPIFTRYEGAFMTYGIGWMICYSLVPNLVTDKLHMNSEHAAFATQTMYQVAIVAALLPAGLLMDRLGPVRTCAGCFALLALYPIGLLLASDTAQLTIVSVFYGLVHAGVNVGWMLGPVALAPTPAAVPQYVAIHATLVGLRGAVFQMLGVGLYMATGSFIAPMAIAAAALLWAGWQMRVLHTRMKLDRPT